MICKLNCQTLAGVAADALGLKSPGCCCCERRSLEDATQPACAFLENSAILWFHKSLTVPKNAAACIFLKGSPSPGKECDILGVRYWGYGCANRSGKSLLPALSCSRGRAGRPPSWEEAAPVEEGLKRISTIFRKQDFVGASYWPDPPSHSRKWPVPSMSTKAPCLGSATPSISLGHLPNGWLKHYHV